ncbi:hypothetical protein V6N13_138046 [Hibiscus sabdariffa]|uniref:Uncharacterized protein n=1 Tax=Hibiscus sabdariffa TaxID=183260 RepID=A0ABR2QCB1_9ROSI
MFIAKRIDHVRIRYPISTAIVSHVFLSFSTVMNENGGDGELRNQLGICQVEIGNYLKRRDIAQQVSSAYGPTVSASPNDTVERKIKTYPA